MMDLTVLIAVVRSLRAHLSGSTLEDVRQDGSRFRLLFAAPGDRALSVIVSIDPIRPWIGRGWSRWPRSQRSQRSQAPGPGGDAIRRELKGLRLLDLTLALGDRRIAMRFADGHELLAHLARHRANLIAVGPDGTLQAAARFPRAATPPLVVGQPYAKPPGAGLPDPRGLLASEIDRRIAQARGDSLDLGAVLARSIFGVGGETARLVVDEARSTGGSVGSVLASRLARVEEGGLEPLVLADADPRVTQPQRLCLLPWASESVPEGLAPFRGPDPAATVGLYHEALDRIDRLRQRATALQSLLAEEDRRLSSAIGRVRGDLDTFADPDVHRLRGEALLAGLSRAVRVGDAVRVPDPYSLDRAELVIPVRPGMPLAAYANECFRLHSRAVRGRAQARTRLQTLEERRDRLRTTSAADASDPESVDRLERELIELGVAIEPARRPGRAGRPMAPRTLGVRTFRGPGGAIVLAGRSAASNERVTFRLAAAEDVWLHALGVRGTHVILRRKPGSGDPDRDALHFAAAIAAWYSEARESPAVDVQWTRRKFVRRRRGAPAGTVVLKKFDVLRIRPATPSES
jgi:predicted ribosome quality control (RQC) complex YloA/Tae2 family protein